MTIPKRKAATNKGDYGKILVIAGSVGMAGAAYLTCKGAYRSGAGLVYLCAPRALAPIMAVKLTCTVIRPVADTRAGTFSSKSLAAILDLARTCDAAAIGPGLGRHAETGKLVKALISRLAIPIVLDADGLNLIADDPAILAKARRDVVITPHPGELSRLLRRSVVEIQAHRSSVARAAAKRFGCVVVLKGHRTVISDGARTAVNTTGNPGMATGGSGDILTGMAATFLAQGFRAFDAARLAVHLHGLAGDIAARRLGEVSLMATDILDALPAAIRRTGK